MAQPGAGRGHGRPQRAGEQPAGGGIKNLLREKKRQPQAEHTGDEERIERALGQRQLVVGPEPFAPHQVFGQLQEEPVIMTGARRWRRRPGRG
jgi:hypothetical protein